MAAMVTHLAYHEEHYPDAQSCIVNIRQRLSAGWMLTQVRGPATGPFAVLYYLEDGGGS
jgi:hypothetical protein